METTRLGTNWNRFVIADNYLVVQQFAAFPRRVSRACEPHNVAKYELRWSDDCRTAEVQAIVETCRRREALYNEMTIVLQTPNTASSSECALSDGSGIWQAKYHERVNAWTGRRQVGTFTFAAAQNAVVESGDDAVYFYTWRTANDGSVVLRDHGSQDFTQRCLQMTTPTVSRPEPLPIEAVYAQQFGGNCTTLTVTPSNADECEQRARRLSDLVLFRVPLPQPAAVDESECRRGCAERLSTEAAVDECTEMCENAEIGRASCRERV